EWGAESLSGAHPRRAGRYQRPAASPRFVVEREEGSAVCLLECGRWQTDAPRHLGGMRTPRERPLGRALQEGDDRGRRSYDLTRVGMSAGGFVVFLFRAAARIARVDGARVGDRSPLDP